MAWIMENPNGRRMIRLSADDVLTIVSQYQQQTYGLETTDYEGLRTQLAQQSFYLPEEA